MLAEKLVSKGDDFAEAWNFGPQKNDAKPVSWVINFLSQKISTYNGILIEVNSHMKRNYFYWIAQKLSQN